MQYLNNDMRFSSRTRVPTTKTKSP